MMPPFPPPQLWQHGGWPQVPWGGPPPPVPLALLGSAAPVPEQASMQTSEQNAVVRLRGLPFSASEQDVFAFFAQHNIVERIAEGSDAVRLLEPNGRPSGVCIVRMRQHADAELAVQELNGQWMGSRYVEVFLEDARREAPATTAAMAPAPDNVLLLSAALPPAPAGPQAGFSPWAPTPWWAPPPPFQMGTAPSCSDSAEPSWSSLFDFIQPEVGPLGGNPYACQAPLP